ncbi:phage holin family protein [Lacticaseibacillus saniviri]|uniref:Integral inner membrane protein n=1 Tax=Lacticaseibacillus saniviri JCM 17471 = DSM 24301 TaxID=1293598 RepID=A0A0R2MX19_9LACO|nr:phage holin family protein [Lacticaseibacillus saniviri]KRO16747.1 hypothetical protein IV56_GL000735 [Lacticaseibacillus saniviri JCM 17471 = DSM 24301]MCG4280987.1 phage holin family protein [Lacticaseibacillus saniviri]
MGFIKRTLLTTLIFIAYAQLAPGQLMVASLGTALAGAIVLGILNGLVRPILKFLSFPITILTFGLFLLVINALMLNLMTWFVPGIAFSSFGSSVILAIVISVINALFTSSRNEA